MGIQTILSLNLFSTALLDSFLINFHTSTEIIKHLEDFQYGTQKRHNEQCQVYVYDMLIPLSQNDPTGQPQ